METENQVCSWQLAGQLYLVAHNSRYMTSHGQIVASAFTVAELGEMLPKEIVYASKTHSLPIGPSYTEWMVHYRISYLTDR